MRTSLLTWTKNLFVCLSYLLSFYCFSTTEIFESLHTQIGSLAKTIFICQLLAFLWLGLILMLKKNPFKTLAFLGLIWVLPSILSHSKLNLLQTILSIDFKSTAPLSVTACAASLSLLVLILMHWSHALNYRMRHLRLRGADERELLWLYQKHMPPFLLLLLLISIPMALIIVFGFILLPLLKTSIDPFLLLLLGAVLFTTTLVYTLKLTHKKKSI